MANVLTGFRIICSILLLLFRPFLALFYAAYITAGITDMLDGAAARKFGTVSRFGSVFDTAADICFAGSCLFRLLPALDMPLWVWIWLAVILLIKLTNIVIGFVRSKRSWWDGLFFWHVA